MEWTIHSYNGTRSNNIKIGKLCYHQVTEFTDYDNVKKHEYILIYLSTVSHNMYF